ncbi:MAG: hypothetical protein HYS12_24540 [Planctomycetes bacterium]|nr:hypothetical protein [Planctomycetota bacterium]
MAQRFLALDWDQQQLHLVAATVAGGSVRFTRAVMLEELSSPNPAEALELGQRLRERLKAAGIAPAPVLACVGRDRVILKEVRYPDVPAHEEPALVRFQAVKELSDAADDVVLDYVPLGTAPTGEKRAQVLVVRRELLSAYQTLCQAAGLRLTGVTPRPYGMAGCLRRLIGSSVLMPPPEPPDSAVALVTVGERWAEFCIVKGDMVLQARSLVVGPGVAGEVRRNLAVHNGQSPQNPVRALYLALSGEQAALREKLVETLSIPVHLFDPFAGAEGSELPTSGRGTFAGAVGLLHLMAERHELPINFAQPKQPRPPRDPNQRRYLLAAAAVLMLLSAGLVVGKTAVDSRHETLIEIQGDVNDLNRQLTQEREKAKKLQALHEWEGVPWPDELYELSACVPKGAISRDFRVLSVEGLPQKAGRQAGANSKAAPTVEDLNALPVAKLHLKIETSPNQIDKLNAFSKNLEEKTAKGEAYYQPAPHSITRREIDKDILIRKRPRAEYTRPIER